MIDLPAYPKVQAENNPTKTITIKDDSFSKPGSVGKKWSPAKGVKFRATHEKPGARKRRKLKRDERYVEYY